ncbi:hypothetical protein N9611_02260 [Flavobacteriaceae bacterium]|nr:hypothetical protein [Flavobacteriaceae bacterium]
MNFKVTSTPTDLPQTPIVARFATIRYDELEENEVSPIYATGILSVVESESTSPSTYSFTSSSGKDRDKDDRGND